MAKGKRGREEIGANEVVSHVSQMPAATLPPDADRRVDLPLLVVSRLFISAIFMTYPACLSNLIDVWRMSATEAGIVQGAFSIAFAISLLAASFACDRIGARAVFKLALAASVVTALLFAFLARSFESAVICMALVGLAQGGTYTPAIMLVSANVDPASKGSAVGWMLAGMSGGYVISIVLSTTMVAISDYRMAFIACALMTIVGWISGWLAVRRADDQLSQGTFQGAEYSASRRRRTGLLTLGYIGHCWELFGMWAWIPAFLAAAVLSRGTMSAIELGLWTALVLHISGFFSSFLSGYAADHFGAKSVLVFFAALGAAGSFFIGWMVDANFWLLFFVAAVYGFASIGDSAVLSSAMTDAVPAQHLGRALGIRSILGIGAGSLSPVAFGAVIDATPLAVSWGYAFSSLGLGGIIALICAVRLKS